MSKYMFSKRQIYSSRGIILLKTRRLSPTFLCWWFSSACQTGPVVVSHLNEEKGAAGDQGTQRYKKQRSSCQHVLDRFDQQYSLELGDLWESARSVLLDPQSWQYGVMLNRFSAATDLTQILQSHGFSLLLPQTDGSKLLRNNPSKVSHSKKQVVGDFLFAPPYVSRGPINDSQLQPCSTSHVLWHDIRSEPSINLPRPSLQCYVNPYPMRFPSQAHRPGQLKQYYLLNAASLLPVLALQVRDGEKVLDLCSAPGGKAVAIMQCASPALLCCNEPDPQRRDWLAKTLESFLPNSLNNRVMVSAHDGRSFGQSEVATYDKVLVDAPCSNDRSWLYSSNSQQGEQRLKERARLPALQVQLLRFSFIQVMAIAVVSIRGNWTSVEVEDVSSPIQETSSVLKRLVESLRLVESPGSLMSRH